MMRPPEFDYFPARNPSGSYTQTRGRRRGATAVDPGQAPERTEKSSDRVPGRPRDGYAIGDEGLPPRGGKIIKVSGGRTVQNREKSAAAAPKGLIIFRALEIGV